MTLTDKDNEPASTILLVEDDVLIRMPIAAYLRECGYKVIEAASGNEARIVLQHKDLHIDVMLADTRTSGTEQGFGLVQWVRKTFPDLKILLAATAKGAAFVAGQLCEEGPLLQKPYDPQIVEQHIRRLLAARARRCD